MLERAQIINRMWAVARLRAKNPDSLEYKYLWLGLKSEFLSTAGRITITQPCEADPLEDTQNLTVYRA